LPKVKNPARIKIFNEFAFTLISSFPGIVAKELAEKDYIQSNCNFFTHHCQGKPADNCKKIKTPRIWVGIIGKALLIDPYGVHEDAKG
jgi:hypothetical protein